MLTHLMSSRNSHRLYNGTKTHSKNDTLRSAISTRIIPAPPLLKRTCDNSYLLSIGIIQTSSPAVPSIRYRITPSSTTLSIWTTHSNLNAERFPREQKELDKFLEENLASGRIRPLNKLRQKDIPFVWTDECQKSFDALKQSITSAPVLRTPQPDLPYLLETDASGFAIGAILSQPHEGQFHPVGFFSKTLLSAERNYPTHDGELLAIVRSFEEWRHLLEGASHPVIVQTDNEALKFFMTLRILSRRQARLGRIPCAFRL